MGLIYHVVLENSLIMCFMDSRPWNSRRRIATALVKRNLKINTNFSYCPNVFNSIVALLILDLSFNF